MLQGATSSMWLVCEDVYMHVTRCYKQYVVSECEDVYMHVTRWYKQYVVSVCEAVYMHVTRCYKQYVVCSRFKLLRWTGR